MSKTSIRRQGNALSAGWSPRDSVIADSLTQAALNGTNTLRPAGLFYASVVCNCTAHDGVATTIQIVLEGSNDGGNDWHLISQTSDAEQITAAGDIRTLGAEGQNSVELERWERIRVRAVETTAGDNWTIVCTLSGHPYPSNFAASIPETVTRAASPQAGAGFVRRGGTRYATVTAECTLFTDNGGGETINFILQGSVDGGTTWDAISDVLNITALGSSLMTQNGSNLIDLGGFNNLRFQGTDVGGGGMAAYVVTGELGVDGADWMVSAGNPGGGGDLPDSALVNFQWDEPGGEAANVIRIVGRMLDMNGAPIPLARTFKFTLGDTSLGGDLDLSTNGTITVVNTGTGVTAVGSNQIVATTDVNGIVDLSILDTAAETVRLSASLDGIPKDNSLVLVRSEEADLIFA